MPRKNLPYVNAYTDHTGKKRYYLRRAGLPQIPLPGKPGGREFMRTYRWALAGAPPQRPIKAELKPRNGHIYFLSDGERVKIGFTLDWQRRQKAYRTHNATTLTLLALQPGYQPDETALHRRFKQYRIDGTEWFYPGPELLDYIKGTIDELNAA